MIADRLQYFLDGFWKFENFTKSRRSEPVLLMDYVDYLWLTYGFFMAYLWLTDGSLLD